MGTPDSQIKNRLEGIRQTATVGNREIAIHFDGNVLRIDGTVVINRGTLTLKEALIASIDSLSCHKNVYEGVFLLLLVQTIGELNEDGETLRQTPFGRMDASLRARMSTSMEVARLLLEREGVSLGEMVHLGAVHAA